MKKAIILVLTFAISVSICQSQSDYSISYYQDTYSEVTTESLEFPQTLLIDFGFEFPFYDTTFNQFKLRMDGYGEFGNGSDDNEFYVYSGEYWATSLENSWGKLNCEINGLNALVLQWRNVVLKGDYYSGNPTLHHLNFQVWFFDSGDIELHFGDFDFANTSFWVDSFGIIGLSGNLVGPGIGILSPGKEKHLFIGGFLDNLQIFDNKYEAEPLRELPPEGFVIKFHRLLPIEENELGKLNVYPNPGTGVFYFDLPSGIQAESIQVHNLAGDLVYKSLHPQNNTINLELLPDGIYTVLLESKTQKVFRKVVKISN